MMQPHEILSFEEESNSWERSERANRHDFLFRNLRSYPRYEANQKSPSCDFPCYHFNTTTGPPVHRTICKQKNSEDLPYLVNTLFDLSITGIHNQAVLDDKVSRLTQYLAKKVGTLPTIPEDSPLLDQNSLSLDLQALRADLKEVKATQSALKLGFEQLREAVQLIISRENDPKPIEATTALVAEQLRKQLIEVRSVLEETKKVVRSLSPDG
uniref:Uncharacterized protein n=1 Tax=Rubus yellow net virus TaxID=198310 RepID=A0A7S6SNB8_9VIRU|nr:hypothetical protein [Rubus yellow net virus]